MIRVDICGFGYWGPKLLRAFSMNPAFEVTAIADSSADQQTKARKLRPAATVYCDGMEMIESPNVDAVAIATPVSTHYALGSAALNHGKHVLVEKPMCASVEEGRELIALAQRSSRTLMVDHTYLFNAAVRKLKELNLSGALGKVTYHSVRAQSASFCSVPLSVVARG